MSLNAELDLTMDQLVRLAQALSKAIPDVQPKGTATGSIALDSLDLAAAELAGTADEEPKNLPASIKRAFGLLLKWTRCDRQLDIGEAAEDLGMTTAYLSQLERGRKPLTPRTAEVIRAWAQALRPIPIFAAAKAHSPAAVELPPGLSRSDAEFWLRKRGEIIDALRAEGLTIVTTMHGVRFMRLGKIEAQTAAQSPAPAPEVQPENLPTKDHIRELAQEALDQIMEQAQVFASAWSLVGGKFDDGNGLSDAEDAKAELRTMVRSLADLAAETVRPAPSPAVAHATEYEQALSEMDGAACPRCLGSGSIPAMSNGGPDAHEIDVDCDHCGGTGSARDAYLKLAEFYRKASSELTQLRYYRWFNEQEKAKQAEKLEAAQQHAYAEGRKDEAESREPGSEDYASGFRDGWIDCRRTMAGFVEPDSAVIAMSIRGNWKPSLGPDPDRPDLSQPPVQGSGS